MRIHLALFGAPTITADGQSRALPCERRTQLLAYLALKRAWVRRSEIAALLWPEQPDKLAYANLRKALFRLQSAPWGARIDVQTGALRFEVDTDVAGFEAALAGGRVADALALRRGDLLAGFDDPGNDNWTSWLGFERDRLRAAWRGAAQQHLDGDLDPASGAEFAARLLDDDPLDDAALRAQMTWLVRAGQGARARQIYRAFAARLQQELGLAPSAELKALHDSLGQAITAAGDAAASSTAAHDDGFIGRTVEMRRIAALLAQSDCRLLCVSGPGGVGKTRLAQRATRGLAAEFPDGATFVPLDDLTSCGQLGGRLARELGIALTGRADPLDQVINALRESRALLVLDNFEQLAAEASVLDRLLSECPGLKLIVTSRVRLGLAGEWMLPLEGLAVPDAEDEDRAEAFDAVRLFIRAAQRFNPTLAAAIEAPGIVDICRQVEGLPLALELAASWTRVLTCEEIAAELRESAELLRTTDASRPERHAGIDVVFEQSWQLLSDAERAALARLAVFHGGFTPQAARAVGAVPLPVLAALADKSLLRKEGARCFLHPLVQQFARVRLEREYDAGGTEAAHSRHFLRGLAEITQRVRQADPPVLREVDADFENIRAAWRLAVRQGPAGDLTRAAYSLMTYCEHRGRQLDGLTLLLEAIEGDSAARPGLAAPAAWLAFRLDRYAEAEALGTKALDAIGPDGRDATSAFRAATVLGAACARLGRAGEAQRWLRQALDLAGKTGDPLAIASALDNLGLIARGRGDLDEALSLYRKALQKHREAGDAGGVALCLNNEGAVHIKRRDLDAARQVLIEARQLCEHHGLPSTHCMIEVNLANVATLAGAPELAVQHARKALELSAQTGRRGNEVEARQAIVWASLCQGDLAAARSELARALTVSISIDRSELIANGVRLFAVLVAAQGANEVAARVLRFLLRQPGLAGAERVEVEQQLRDWGASAEGGHWTGPPLDELVHHIVAETGQAYAPLIAGLRGDGGDAVDRNRRAMVIDRLKPR